MKKKKFKGVELFRVNPDILSKVKLDGVVGNSIDGRVGFDGRGSKRRLIVTAPSTHAGRLTANLGLYQPRRMVDQIGTFTEPFNKPVLVAHDQKRDAIGRVIATGYEAIDYDFLKKPADQMDEKETFDLIRMLMKTGMLYDDSFRGLGSGVLSMEISDKDAIEKFLDERYMTFSVRVGTDNVYCPITGKPFMDFFQTLFGEEDDEETYSPHHPGDEVDGMTVFSVLDNLQYQEVSPVNIPADEHAIVRSMQEVIVKDSKNENVINTKLVYDIVGAFDVSQKDAPEPKQEDNKEQINMNKKQKETKQTVSLESVSVYKGMKSVIADALSDLGSKPLSDEELAALSGKSFCGPSRTFPILDEAHYKASLVVLDSMKMDAEKKENILKQINRKADQMGLLLDPVVRDANQLMEKLDSLSDYDFSEVSEKILEEFKSRGFGVSDSATLGALAPKTGDASKVELEESLAKVVALEEDNKKLVLDCKRNGVISCILSGVFVDNLKVDSLSDLIDEESKKSLKEVQDSLTKLLEGEDLQKKVTLYLEGMSGKGSDGNVKDDTLTGGKTKDENVKDVDPMGDIILECFKSVLDELGESHANDYLDSVATYIEPAQLKELRTMTKGE